MIDNNLKRKPDESVEQFCSRIYDMRETLSLKWDDVSDTINSELGWDYSSDKYRKDAYKYYYGKSMLLENTLGGDGNDELDGIRFERTKLADERSQVTSLYKRMAREESLKEIAHDAAINISNNIKLPAPSKAVKGKSENKALLLISDWHYGIDVKNAFNTYNQEVARNRIAQLQDRTLEKCQSRGITELTVINLGDLIAGGIHLPIRLNSRIDVITQIMEVSEIYAEMLANMSKYVNITAYSVLDNHSRIDPNKENSLQLESLARITDWYLKERLKDYSNIKIMDNSFDINIATFTINGFNILGVHGDLDKQPKLVDNLTSFTKSHYDLIVSAHMHHFSADEKNNTMVICNGSLMATDDYAFKLRLNSEPSQTLIIISKDSVCEEIHRIKVK